MLRLAAYEEGSKLIGHRVLPILGLCPGYRHIPLFNEVGQPLHLPCLFVHITVGDYVPNSLTDLAEALANPIKYQSELERRAMQLAIMADEDTAEREREKEERQETEDVMSLKGTGGSTPECASPTRSTIGFMKRTPSSRPRGSKDGSPTMVPHRTDSAKSLAASSKEVEAPPTASLETANLTPDSVARILEHRSVKEKQAELASKLDQLRKKKEKEISRLADKLLRTPSKPKNPLNKRALKIVKAFSVVSLETAQSGSVPPTVEETEAKKSEVKKSHCEKKLHCERNFLLMEREVNEKYLDSIFQCAEKVMTKSQSSQLKALENLHAVEANDVMKRLEQETKVEEQEKGSLSSISREDRQRERRAMLVKKGVTERGKLQELYTGRRTELESAQERVRQDLKNDWEARRQQLADQYKSALELLEAQYS